MAGLQDTLENDLTYQILYTANFHKSFRRRFHQQFVSPELHPDITTILYFISSCPDITQAEMAKYLFKGKAHVGKILNEMEKLGLIKREQHENYIKNIILPKGEELNKKAFKAYEKLKYTLHFTEEETKQFLSYILKYREMLEKIVDVKLK